MGQFVVVEETAAEVVGKIQAETEIGAGTEVEGEKKIEVVFEE